MWPLPYAVTPPVPVQACCYHWVPLLLLPCVAADLQVVRGAGSLYADTVLQIPHVSAAGAAQLAADAEYFANVMSALAVAPPPELITLQLFAGVPPDSFGGIASGAIAGGSADAKVGLGDLCRLRNTAADAVTKWCRSELSTACGASMAAMRGIPKANCWLV